MICEREGCRSASGATKSRREGCLQAGQGCGPNAQIPEREGQAIRQGVKTVENRLMLFIKSAIVRTIIEP